MGKRPTTPDPARHGSGRARAPELVGTLLDRARTATARRAGVALDRETWGEVVGERVARRTKPGSIRDGTLTVVVESPVWAQELSLLSADIIAALTRRGLQLQAIRFRIGTVSELLRPPPARPRQPPVELPDDVREHLAAVDDPELRQVIASAVGHSLANAKKRELKPKRGGPAPRSAEPGSARSGSDAPKPSAGPRRSRGER
jgi:hypothetical protein